jgi:Zn-dependent membrane protease YugP
MYVDEYYLILVAPAILLSLWAQVMVKSTFAKYSRIRCGRNITGQAAAAFLLRANNIRDVRIEPVRGSLTDHYSPSAKVLRLSQPVFNKNSIAAVGVAAHETGHAIQHARSWGPLVLRSTLVPVANIGSSFGPLLAVAGFFFSLPILINIGIILFGGSVLFYLVTLPVEFNASARAIAILQASRVLSPAEIKGVKKVLSAAAMTYVASALTALLSLVRLILQARARRAP